MRRLHGITGEQHDICQRCGEIYPMSQLGKQWSERCGELMLCVVNCMDNVDNQNRDRQIATTLAQGVSEEGVDHRAEDWGWFASAGENF